MKQSAEHGHFTAEEFAVFKEEFQRWQTYLGLNGYRVYFIHKPLGSSYADITVEPEDMVATVCLNSQVEDHAQDDADPKANARHEAMHLLIARMDGWGRNRFATLQIMNEAAEELVRRLETVVPPPKEDSHG